MRTDAAPSPSPLVRDLHPARILALCGTKHIARRIVLYETVDSTNAAAMAAAAAGAPDGTVFIAEDQTFGRGRKGRTWVSSRGSSLTLSLLLRPRRMEEGLTALLALAVVDALGGLLRGLGMKWPNDVILKGMKLGGILAESKDDSVVLGLGLNVNEAAGDFPAGIAREAISMRMAAGKGFDRGLVLCRILVSFETLYDRFQKEGFAPFREDVQRRLIHIGKRVIIESGGTTHEGTMIGITNEGYLCLDVGGTERVFSSGDLTLRKGPRKR
jgi:BirA family biotin operon repressor/biotin-[acetyl-CoA-carboxylase] ligase